MYSPCTDGSSLNGKPLFDPDTSSYHSSRMRSAIRISLSEPSFCARAVVLMTIVRSVAENRAINVFIMV